MPSLKYRIQNSIRKTRDLISEKVLPFTHSEIRKAQNKFRRTKYELDQRTSIDDARRLGTSEYPDILHPPLPYSYEVLYDVPKYEATTGQCINALRKEMFRNGIDIKPSYKFRCTKCGTHYDHQPEGELCSQKDCNGALEEPDIKNKLKIEKFFNAINANRQTIIQVSEEAEDDLNIADDMWVLARQDYEVDEAGNIKTRRIKEVIRQSPKQMRWITDDKGRIGGKYAVCLMHRHKVYKWKDSDIERSDGKCPLCNRKLHDVKVVGLERDAMNTPESYWIEGEVIHDNKFRPSLTYGFSPIAVLWEKIQILYSMDEYMFTAYHKKRAPSGIINIKGRNEKSIRAQWEKEKLMLATDPYHIPVIVSDPDNGSGESTFVKFLDSIKEMDFMAARNEIKKEIGVYYGVMPLFQGDLSQSGGLNNEGLQVTVTTRAIESDQKIHNTWHNQIIKLMGIEDWESELLPPEERDEMAQKLRVAQEILNAQGLTTLGYDVSIREDADVSEYFKFEKIEQSTVVGSDMEVDQDPSHIQGMPEPVQRMKEQRIEKEFWSQASAAIKAGTIFRDYARLGKADEQIVIKILEQAFKSGRERFSPEKTILQIASKTKLTKEEARRIVRTEETSVINTSRELGFKRADPENENKFRWAVTHDDRLSTQCRNIEAEVNSRGQGKGVSMAELDKIVQKHGDIGAKGKFKTRKWVPHISCRSLVSRVV